MSNQPPQPDPWYIRLIKFLGPYLLTAGGLAGGYEIAPKITQNPVSQLVIAFVAGLLAYALSFINKGWHRLEGPLVDKTAAWIPTFLNNRFVCYRRKYLYYISHAHRVLEFNGLVQRPASHRALHNIFVELDIMPTPPHLASSHMLKRPPRPPSDLQAIWYYLSNETHRSDTLVILGPAGNGKTTLLKYITFSLSEARLRLQLRRERHISYPVPVLLYIREQAATIKNKPESTLPELLQVHVQNKGHLTIPLRWFERQFKRGKCLIMLDGLDEVPDGEERKQVIAWVRKQILAYASNRFVVTSRPHGYDTQLDDAIVLNVLPFTLTQIKSFVHKWYLIDELVRSGRDTQGAQIRANESAGKFLIRLNQQSSLRELAANPLLLTMIIILFSTDNSLPDNRVDLYCEIFQVLLYRRREAIGLTPKLNVQQKLAVLQPLAFHLLQRHLLEIQYAQLCRVITLYLTRVVPDITPADFLQDIAQNSGLFLEIAEGTWGFAHKTLQEYLTATYLKERRNRESILLSRLNDDWWHETICFYCAQADATSIIQSCLTQADTSLPILNLALACNDQKLKADTIVTQQIEALLQTGVEDPDPQKRQIVAEALLKRRLESMIYLHDNTYMDTSLVSCAEYQLFLSDQSTQGYYYHPWHWTSDTFQAGHGYQPVLGVQPSDIRAFCAWLTTRENGLWRYRLPRKDEREQILSHIKQTVRSQPVGFWAEENRFAWLSGAAPEHEDLTDMVLNQLQLDRARALAYDRVRTYDLRDAIHEMLELERKLNDGQVPDISSLLIQHNKILPLDFDVYGDRFSDRDFIHYLHSIKNIMLSDRFIVSTDAHGNQFLPYKQSAKQLCWLIRYGGQLQARHYYARLMKQQQYRIQGLIQFFQKEFETHGSVCHAFILLELRTQGRLPPWEGILLVKEHHMDGV